MSFLTSVSFDFTHGHALDANTVEGIFDLVEFKRFDNGLNFFHKPSSKIDRTQQIQDSLLLISIIGGFRMLSIVQTLVFSFLGHAKSHQAVHQFENNRITSYNVCYTKLLRPSKGVPSGL